MLDPIGYLSVAYPTHVAASISKQFSKTEIFADFLRQQSVRHI
ncbi:hypothetical protein CEV31_2458 [Brucella thiophenivorans]|uniref:Uncharacterized protein n=1 Tax=Brucella thiophenivorans TaxID=571255 RepID=A0A256FW93_9HYPH|nr:hypothetical protein CEV31_2458 [Brucella thiophenivorans]